MYKAIWYVSEPKLMPSFLDSTAARHVPSTAHSSGWEPQGDPFGRGQGADKEKLQDTDEAPGESTV